MANQYGESCKFNGDIASRNGISIDVKDLIKYYITENHSREETVIYFGVTSSFIAKIISHYHIKKPRQLSNVHNKKTCLARYGDPTYNNIEQNKKTCLERYGVENVYQSEEIKEKCAATKIKRYNNAHFVNSEKRAKTNLAKYGSISPTASKEVQEKARKTCLAHFGVEYPMQSKEVQAKYDFKSLSSKAFNTKKLRGTANSSKIQDWFISELKNIYGETDVFSEYKDERYPYHCDAYIKSLDKFFELNIYFTHGGHPFSDSEEDRAKLAIWKEKAKKSKFFKNAIRIWTVTDPEKQLCAKNNNLDYTMFYYEKDVVEFINNLKEVQNC